MLKTICSMFLFFAFISCSQLSAKEGIHTAVKAAHAGDDDDTVVTAENVKSKDNSSIVNGKVIKFEIMEDLSNVATIKDSKGELHRCKML